MIFLFVKKIIQNYKVLAIITLVTVFLVGGFIYKKASKKQPIIVDALEKAPEEDDEDELDTYSVDIKGAVNNPGVYKVVKGTIVNDVIAYAGGLNNNATTNNINLSKKVADEMVIYIYTKSEFNKLVKENKIKTEAVNTECKALKNSVEITECITNGGSSIIKNDSEVTTSNSNKEVETTKLVNINTATVEELCTLTGVGESKAKSIIEYRNTNGNFAAIEDIKQVSGIGDALYEKIKDSITV